MKTGVFQSEKSKRVRKAMFAYSIVLLGGIALSIGALLLTAPANAANFIDRGIACSGGANSGASCNVLGYPNNEGYMFGCYDLTNDGVDNYKCYEVQVNTLVPGTNYCYYDGTYHASCGCDINACQAACEANNAGKAPGHYQQPWICDGCKQNMLCGCDITGNPPVTTPPVTLPPGPTCPNTQARLNVNGTGWVESGTYELEDVNIISAAVFINQDISQIFRAGTVEIVTPNPAGGRLTSTYSNGNVRDLSTPYYEGTYRVRARVDGELCDVAEITLRDSTPPPVTDLTCWQTGCNDSDKQCASGLACQNNRCVNPTYPNNPDCQPTENLQCWQTGCNDVDKQCTPNSGLVCQNNRCVNPTYPTSETCAPPGTTNLQCWQTGCNDADKQCAPGSGLVCQNNRCVNPNYPANPDCKPDVILGCYEEGCSLTGNSCQTGLTCQNNRCVNPQYPNSSTCAGQPGITLNKVAVNGTGPYTLGQDVLFRIDIANTGQTTFDTIAFSDSYNPARLELLRIENAYTGVNLTSNFTINRTLGRISSSDITTFLGNLAPGQTFRIRFVFRALSATTNTCNDVSINPDNSTWMDDDACISINQPPVTDL